MHPLVLESASREDETSNSFDKSLILPLFSCYISLLNASILHSKSLVNFLNGLIHDLFLLPSNHIMQLFAAAIDNSFDFDLV